jgi:hypothetical protein
LAGKFFPLPKRESEDLQTAKRRALFRFGFPRERSARRNKLENTVGEIIFMVSPTVFFITTAAFRERRGADARHVAFGENTEKFELQGGKYETRFNPAFILRGNAGRSNRRAAYLRRRRKFFGYRLRRRQRRR